MTFKQHFANKIVRVTPENITEGEGPKDENYIPVVYAQSNTNEYINARAEIALKKYWLT